MVRFIITLSLLLVYSSNTFTFHYGQIYYLHIKLCVNYPAYIYIPLWLDLLLKKANILFIRLRYLHSTMVRFIIYAFAIIITARSVIYIPLWLDLLFFPLINQELTKWNLHSTMVRFIILPVRSFGLIHDRFTFHYGQIYYEKWLLNESSVKVIYIPLWLDLLSISFSSRFHKSLYLHSTMVRFIIMK